MSNLKSDVELAITMLRTGMPEYDARDVLEVLTRALEQQPAGEPVAWWKKHRDGSIELNEARTFIAEDALATGRRPLVFGDAHPQPAAQWVGRTQDFSQH